MPKFDRTLGTSKREQGVLTSKCKNKLTSKRWRNKVGIPSRTLLLKYGHVKAVEILKRVRDAKWKRTMAPSALDQEQDQIKNSIL